MLLARSTFAEAKFVALCAALKAAGKERLAKKLFAGWKVGKSAVGFFSCVYGTP